MVYFCFVSTTNEVFFFDFSFLILRNCAFLILRLFLCDCLPAFKPKSTRDLTPPGWQDRFVGKTASEVWFFKANCRKINNLPFTANFFLSPKMKAFLGCSDFAKNICFSQNQNFLAVLTYKCVFYFVIKQSSK